MGGTRAPTYQNPSEQHGSQGPKWKSPGKFGQIMVVDTSIDFAARTHLLVWRKSAFAKHLSPQSAMNPSCNTEMTGARGRTSPQCGCVKGWCQKAPCGRKIQSPTAMGTRTVT